MPSWKRLDRSGESLPDRRIAFFIMLIIRRAMVKKGADVYSYHQSG